jgi:hypothetical protein
MTEGARSKFDRRARKSPPLGLSSIAWAYSYIRGGIGQYFETSISNIGQLVADRAL